MPQSATDCHRLPQTSTDCHWLPLTATDYHWLPMTATDCHWLPETATDCHWLPLTATDCHWLPLTANDCHWLSPTPLTAIDWVIFLDIYIFLKLGHLLSRTFFEFGIFQSWRLPTFYWLCLKRAESTANNFTKGDKLDFRISLERALTASQIHLVMFSLDWLRKISFWFLIIGNFLILIIF